MDKLRSIWTYISGMNLAHILVLALVVKSIIYDISYSSFLLTLPVLAFEGYKLYLKSKQPDPVILSREVQQELGDLKSKLTSLTMEKSLVKPNQRYF